MVHVGEEVLDVKPLDELIALIDNLDRMKTHRK